MRLCALLGVLAVAVPWSAQALTLAECLALRETECIEEIAAATALGKDDPMQRIAALVDVAKVLAEGDDEDDALELLGFAEATLGTLAEPDARDEALALLAEGFAAAGDFGRALAIVDTMQDEIRRDFARSEVASKASDAEQYALVEKLLPILNDQLGDELKEDMATAFVAAGDWDHAHAILMTMTYWNPEVARWAMGEFVARDRFTDAIHQFETITAPGLREFASRGFVDGLIRTGDLVTAQQMAMAIRTTFQADGALVDVVQAYAQRGDEAHARAAIAEIDDGETQGDGLIALAAGLAGRGDLATALAIAAKTQTDPPPTRSVATAKRLPRLVFAAIALAQARGGNVVGALTTTQRIDDKTDREAALVAIADQQLGVKDTAGARLGLDELARTVAQNPIAPAVLRDAVRLFAQIGDARRAVALAQSLPVPTDRAATLMKAALAMDQPAAFAEIVDAVAAALDRAEPRDRRPNTMAALAVLEVRAGKTAHAASILEPLDEDLRTRALLAIAFPAAQPLP